MKKPVKEDPRTDPKRQAIREPYRHPPTTDLGEKKITPQPIGDRCNPLCPLFICTKNAQFIANKPFKGRIIRVAQCRLIGGDCIGGECQYSSCRLNSLLPDGRCAKALEKRISRPSDEEIFKLMMQFEEYDISDLRR